ncbi:hypothetical protein CBE01nite_35450 [Clostridium beijerinckii]|uniref:Uncharacterized protein n=1 Tax=Clostridium beijerinckii TaxID=1520 RepID=A0AB74VHE8_CLOBE|nr:hypothetical protein [Clostridium beijerinckii]NRZ25155.1 hypothetical protein [Clostridium beijerinckii]NYB99869.1 hypothetical protein [Clostridium beijerinckii]OOM26480.1 hypothetical protein CLBEI_10740 [Clostridium beijerinckii]QUN35943.1 hypothetical protein KEC93_03685 [Clostridium beijerinckii]SQB13374.1 Uncharacterised protein [Clostridium beijerinckii]
MRVKDVLRETDIVNYKKLMEMNNKKKSEKLSERDIRELMSHSSYTRHKGAIKQVK